jgi:hypothetical protein
MRFSIRRVSSITVLALAGAAVFGLPMASGASHAQSR